MAQALPQIEIDVIPGLVVFTRFDGIVQAGNQQFFKTTGFTLKEIEGTLLTGLWNTPEDTITDILNWLDKHPVWQKQICHKKKDGGEFHELCSISKVPANDTDVFYLLKTGQIIEQNPPEFQPGLNLIPYPAVIVQRSDQTVVWVNDAFCKKTGYLPNEILKNNQITAHIFQASEDWKHIERQLTRDDWTDNLEVSLLRKDEKIIESILSARTISFKGQDCVLCAWTDISELKKTIRQLDENEQSYRNVMESSPIAIALTRSSDAQYVDVNEAWSKRTGFKKEEVLGRTSPELNVYRDLNVRKKLWKEFSKKGYVDDLELAFANRFGENLYSLVSARQIQFKGDECLLYISTKIDKLKAVQKSLAEREENYRTILEIAPYSITISKYADDTYLQVNKIFTSRSGYTSEEVIGRSPMEVGLYINPSDRQRLIEILKKEGNIKDYEVPFRAKNGTITENLISISTFQFQGEKCIITIAVDITDRKQTERELSSYRKDLEKKVIERTRELETAQNELLKKGKLAVLGQLTATVSHELRNPLGVIRSSNFYLQRKSNDKNEKTRKHFKRIDEQITHCDSIVSELLEFTQGPSLVITSQHWDSWIIQVVEQVMEQEDLYIHLDLHHDLPPIPHDQEKMRRVLFNLLNNAVQAVNAKKDFFIKENEDFQAEIKVCAVSQGQTLILSVTDNGIGMDDNTLKNAFEPLFTTKATGTGIGLAVVKKIVEDHNGTVLLETQLNKSTCITITISHPASGSS